MTAKCLATAWEMPLLRIDLGALKGKFVGESEQKLRKALDVAKTVGKCILWFDEIEKAVSSGEGVADGGVSADQLGALLTFMQEPRDGVFIFGTSNNVKVLPPEFLRAGRWDDLWFVDLPNTEERIAIGQVMAKKFQHCDKVDTKKIAAATDGYTGAEIEAAFSDALHIAFSDNGRNVKSADVIEAVESRVPLSVSMKEDIEDIRSWAKGRARNASEGRTTKERAGRDIE